MKEALLVLNAVYFLFGATMYVGTMWVLRFFLYPTWRSLTPDNVGEHFGVPTLLATRFFTLVVPLMFVSGVVLVVSEWGDAEVWLGVGCLAGIGFLTYVGQALIIPVNERVRGGDYDGPVELTVLLKRWMHLNDLRFWGSTATWLVAVAYLVAKPDLYGALA